jgi:hypothetical protein
VVGLIVLVKSAGLDSSTVLFSFSFRISRSNVQIPSQFVLLLTAMPFFFTSPHLFSDSLFLVYSPLNILYSQTFQVLPLLFHLFTSDALTQPFSSPTSSGKAALWRCINGA